jgi:serine/threonine-protein kinase
VSYSQGSELKRSKYRILGLIGQGQFGRVYCAAHRQNGRLVALKNLEHRRFPTNKFLRELRFLLSLQHPNIVTCHALEHTRTGRYLVMDYCEGGTMRGLMEEDCRLSLSQSIKLIVDILKGLEQAHNRGIVHCDIKPENILLSFQPTGWVARISDFGIAKLSQEMDDEESSNTGSPAYMAPERFYGQYSLSSDLYAVGVMLFELLAGHRPFSGVPADLMLAHLNKPVKIPDSVSEIWHPVLLKALQKLPGRRFKSANEMLLALKSIELPELAHLQSRSTAAYVPILEPTPQLPLCPCQSLRQRSLSAATLCMAVESPQTIAKSREAPTYPEAGLYRSSYTELVFEPTGWQVTGDGSPPGQPEPGRSQVMDMGSPVKDILLRPQGCFVVTETALYRVSMTAQAKGRLTSQYICDLYADEHVTVEQEGRWVAIADLPGQERGHLRFLPLACAHAPVWVSSTPIEIQVKGTHPRLLRLMPMDASHLAVAFRVASRPTSKARSATNPDGHPATVFEVFTRRSNYIGSLTIPLEIGHFVATPTPYRLLATDEYETHSVLQIDLKPYRIARFGVEIAPKLLLATSWGSILVDKRGRIVLLDEEGRQIGRIDGPEHPTAIASFDHYGLLIATWDGNQGKLHTIDLRTCDIDLMF